MPTLPQIQESIDARLAELRTQIRSLESARAALRGDDAIRVRTPRRPAANAGTAPPTTAAPSRPRKRRRSATSSAKQTDVLLAGKLLSMLEESAEGLSVTAITRQANARTEQVRELLAVLEREGQVRRSGAGRASRWRRVTDEERIAERAAELEQRMASGAR